MKWKGLILAAIITGGFSATAQETESDSLGVIGDNLDLYAVLNAFKDAESVEAFEKSINDPESKINNIDLNEDDEVDYIRVIDNVEEDAHAIVLRVDLDENESQDLAVIEIEKSGDENATIQIVGDEEIYGDDYIIEPAQDEAITKRLMMPNLIVINVWGWPCVRFIYRPAYRPWISPYRWRVYPRWWKPWRPVKWRTYHVHHHHHHVHFHRVTVRRHTRAHRVYRTHRKTCVRVRTHKHHHSHHGHKTQNHGHKTSTGTRKVTGNKNAANKKQQPVNKSPQRQGASTNKNRNQNTQRKSNGNKNNKSGRKSGRRR